VSTRDRSRWVSGNLASSGIFKASISLGWRPIYLSWGVDKCSMSSKFYSGKWATRRMSPWWMATRI
jgi:hypothetical protein